MRNDPEVAADRYRTIKLVLLGMFVGWLTLWLGLGIQGGKLSGVGDRLGRVADAFTEDPTTTTVPVDPAVQP